MTHEDWPLPLLSTGSGVGKKSCLGGEPEAQPPAASFSLAGKINLQTPIHGPPCKTGPQKVQAHSATEGSLGMGCGWGTGEQCRTAAFRPKSLWRVFKREPLYVLKQTGQVVNRSDGCSRLNQRQRSRSSGTMKLIKSLLHQLHRRLRNDPVQIQDACRSLLVWESAISLLRCSAISFQGIFPGFLIHPSCFLRLGTAGLFE